MTEKALCSTHRGKGAIPFVQQGLRNIRFMRLVGYFDRVRYYIESLSQVRTRTTTALLKAADFGSATRPDLRKTKSKVYTLRYTIFSSKTRHGQVQNAIAIAYRFLATTKLL